MRILKNFAHLDLITNGWRRLRSLHVVNLGSMNVVLASSRGSAAWIAVDTSYSLLVLATCLLVLVLTSAVSLAKLLSFKSFQF